MVSTTFAGSLPVPLDCADEATLFLENTDAPRAAAIRPWRRRPARASRCGVCRRTAGLRSVARRLSRTRAGERHFGGDLAPGDGPHGTRYVRLRADAEPARIHRSDLPVH